MDRVVVFDIETVPDLAAGRALLGEAAAGLDEAALRLRLGQRYAREGQDPATAFLKPPLLTGMAVDAFGAAVALGGFWVVLAAFCALLAAWMLRPAALRPPA